jgi:hypothetical protein
MTCHLRLYFGFSLKSSTSSTPASASTPASSPTPASSSSFVDSFAPWSVPCVFAFTFVNMIRSMKNIPDQLVEALRTLPHHGLDNCNGGRRGNEKIIAQVLHLVRSERQVSLYNRDKTKKKGSSSAYDRILFLWLVTLQDI